MSVHKHITDSGFVIAPAVLSDLKPLHDLEKVCFELDAWPILDLIGVLTLPQIIRFKAVDDDKLVGFIAVDLRRVQKTAWIATLAVLPEYRKLGIASALVSLSESEVDLPRIKLSVRHTNLPAIELYKKFGYQHVDTWPNYYKGGDNALVFEKFLSDT